MSKFYHRRKTNSRVIWFFAGTCWCESVLAHQWGHKSPLAHLLDKNQLSMSGAHMGDRIRRPWIFIWCVEAAKLASSRDIHERGRCQLFCMETYLYVPMRHRRIHPAHKYIIYTRERAAVCVRVYFSLDLLLWVSMVTAGPERAGELRVAARGNGQSKISTGTVLLCKRTACVCVAPGCLLFWYEEEKVDDEIFIPWNENSFVW